MLKKISIFAVISLLLCSIFCVSIFADNVNTENFELDVNCPNCDEKGLVYNADGEFFECDNEECGYMYSIECPFCEGGEFYTNESGLYFCSTVGCGKALTLTEIQDNMVLSGKPVGGKHDQNFLPGDFGERASIALQGTVTGMLMVFSVLALLWGIVTLSKVVFYDLPNKKKEREIKKHTAGRTPVAVPDSAPEALTVSEPEVAEANDDGELAAVITAAIAAMLDSEEYKNEFVGGFRVVSFKRSAKSAWNRK